MTTDAPIAHDPTLCAKLRARLKADGFAAYLVPHTDAHQSEYLPANGERLAHLTGFSGSAGLAIVMADEAALFVDGRYTLQAQTEVDPQIFTPQPLTATAPFDWLRTRLAPGDRLAFDPWLHTPAGLEPYDELCAATQTHLVAVDANPIDALWADRPAPPSGPIEIWPTPFAPLTSAAKRDLLAADIAKTNADAAVISAGDGIAWIFNIRAQDVPFTPLVLAYALIYSDARAQFFIDPARLSRAVRAHLGDAVEICPPDTLGQVLDDLGAAKKAVRVATRTTPAWIVDRLKRAGAHLRPGSDPCQLMKARKTAGEIDGVKRAHRRDGAALVKFLAWLDAEGPTGHVTELSAAAKLDGLRAANEHFRGLSFPTISGSGPNGAIVHYRVTEASNRSLQNGDLYLVDSGAQYLDGTTDVTRTIAIGSPSATMKDRFTRVLKGHIAISQQHFPRGTCGQDLDILARRALWDVGLDYDHGTGHGVGTYLGVHEGPQGISKRGQGAALEPGMVLSNEPGFYQDGAFGMRIENLIVVVEVPTPAGGNCKMLGFEPLTIAPIDRTLVACDLLTAAEQAWLNAYHQQVLRTLAPLLDPATRAWLRAATAPLCEY